MEKIHILMKKICSFLVLFAIVATADIVLAASSITDTDGDTKVQTEKTANENKIRFDTAGVERMIIDSWGYAGIGTSSPSSYTQANKALTIYDNAFSGLSLVGNRTGVDAELGQVSFYNGTTSLAKIEVNRSGADNNAMVNFWTLKNGSGMNLMTFKDGKVGIDTTSPAATLHNNGDFITKGPWADVRAYGAVPDDGTDDATAIQAALDAVNTAGGGVVFVPKGTYLLNNALVIKDKTALIGTGWATILKVNASVRAIKTPGGGYYTYNIILSDFQIDGNKANLTIVDPGNEGLQSAIDLDQVDGVTVSNLYIHDAVMNGIYVNNSPKNVLITGSRWENNGKTGSTSGGRGIVFGISPQRFRIIGNYISGNLFQGIGVQSEGGSHAEDFIITDNNIYQNSGNGIDIGDNVISSVVTQNIYILGGVVKGNTINANGGSGIRIFSAATQNAYGATSVTDRTVVSGNNINANTAYGVYLLAANNGKTDRILVVGNSITGNSLNGILVSGSNVRYNSILDNVLFSNGSPQISSGGTATVIGGVVTGTDGIYRMVTGLSIGEGDNISKHISVPVTGLNFGSIAGNSSAQLNTTVSGASVGDSCYASPGGSLTSGCVWSAWVSAANTVTIRILNGTNSAVDPDGAGLTWRIDIWKH